MKTIIDKNTGELLYATVIDVQLSENQSLIDEMLTQWMLKPFYNFETKEFYETATEEEIKQYKDDFLIE